MDPGDTLGMETASMSPYFIISVTLLRQFAIKRRKDASLGRNLTIALAMGPTLPSIKTNYIVLIPVTIVTGFLHACKGKNVGRGIS